MGLLSLDEVEELELSPDEPDEESVFDEPFEDGFAFPEFLA